MDSTRVSLKREEKELESKRSHSQKMSTVCAAIEESAPVTEVTEQKKPLKPCCACPETKKVRDACVIEKGEENCSELIEAHKDCMRALGFKI